MTATSLPPAAYCEQCGRPLGEADHTACAARELDPPRFCAECGRRLVVQVTPLRWVADCSRHGRTTSREAR